jgi:hypothetical protein
VKIGIYTLFGVLYVALSVLVVTPALDDAGFVKGTIEIINTALLWIILLPVIYLLNSGVQAWHLIAFFVLMAGIEIVLRYSFSTP